MEYLTDVIRATVIMEWTTFTPEGVTRRGKDWQIFKAAIERLRLHKLAASGDFTYAELGVPTTSGVLPAKIIREHLFIEAQYEQAYREKKRLR